MACEFVYPVHTKDLLCPQKERFYVQNRVDVGAGSVLEVLDDVEIDLSSDPSRICENKNFDALFAVAQIWGKASTEAQKRTIDVLSDVFLRAVASGRALETEKITSENEKQIRARRSRHRNMYKMITYLFELIIDQAERQAVDKVAAKRIRRTKKAKAATASKDSGVWEKGRDKESVIAHMMDLLQLDLSTFWNLPQPEEDFLTCVRNIVAHMMTNRANVSQAAVKHSLLGLVTTLAQKYDHRVPIASTLINLLHTHEHVQNCVADLMTSFVDSGNQDFVGDLIREIGRLEATTDTTGVKHVASFLVSIAQRLDKLLLANISTLMPHLSADSYTMRNGVVESIGHIIAGSLSENRTDGDNDEASMTNAPPTGGDERNDVKETRNSLLEILERRFADKHAYVRAKVCKTWNFLAERRLIPLKNLRTVTELAVGRLYDRSANVRKAAIHLLVTIMRNNPYGATLKASEYANRLAECENRLLMHHKAMSAAQRRKPGQGDDGDDGDEDGEEGGDEDGTGDAAVADMDDKENSSEAASNAADEDVPEFVPEAAQRDMKLRNFLAEATAFIAMLDGASPVMCTLLGSKNQGDVKEAIAYFREASRFFLSGAQIGVRKMLALLWKKDAALKQCVLQAYRQLYFGATDDDDSVRLSPPEIAHNVINWTKNATLEHLTSLEQLVEELMATEAISHEVTDLLWAIFAGQYRKPAVFHDKSLPGKERSVWSAEERRGALIILSMVGQVDESVIRANVSTLINVGLGPRYQRDGVVAKYVCIALQALSCTSRAARAAARVDPKAGPLEKAEAEERLAAFRRYSPSHGLFAQLIRMVVQAPLAPRQWFAAAEQAIATIYSLGEHPDRICAGLIRALARQTFGVEQPQPGSAVASGDANDDVDDSDGDNSDHAEEDDGEESAVGDAEASATSAPTATAAAPASQIQVRAVSLAKLLYAVGHVALKQFTHLEDIQAELRRRTAAEEAAEAARRQAEAAGEEAIEKELGLGARMQEDLEDEHMQAIADSEIIQSNLLGNFGPLIVRICSNVNDAFEGNRFVQEAAVSALMKFMCVSKAFCEKHLRLLFTLLKESPAASVRSNIVIAVGDLAFRFPNTIEPWTRYLYARLDDGDASVRKNTLMVLSHLILNDMIKVKDQIGAIAQCIDDEDERIASLAQLFFQKLASKSTNALYNVLPDVVRSLTHSAKSKQSLQRIMKFLFDFIAKDRQTENLVRKLFQRLQGSKGVEEQRDIASCLSLLNFTDKAVVIMWDMRKVWTEYLSDAPVWRSFDAIVNQARKQAKVDTKVVLDDVESLMKQVWGKTHPGEALPTGKDLDHQPTITHMTKKKVVDAPKRMRTTRKKSQRAKRGRATYVDDSSDSDDLILESEESSGNDDDLLMEEDDE